MQRPACPCYSYHPRPRKRPIAGAPPSVGSSFLGLSPPQNRFLYFFTTGSFSFHHSISVFSIPFPFFRWGLDSSSFPPCPLLIEVLFFFAASRRFYPIFSFCGGGKRPPRGCWPKSGLDRFVFFEGVLPPFQLLPKNFRRVLIRSHHERGSRVVFLLPQDDCLLSPGMPS